ncbi:MAG: TerD family protein [Pseudomonadota bacterium]
MTDQHDIYIRRKRALLPPTASGTPAAPHLLATLHKNVQGLGFMFTERLYAALEQLSEQQLYQYGLTLMHQLKKAVGAHVQFRLMYPNFPLQVMEMSEATLYANALHHYWTHKLPYQELAKRPELVQFVHLRPLDVGSTDELMLLFGQLLKMQTAYGPTEQADVAWIIKQYPHQLLALLPEVQRCKENLAFVGAQLLLHYPAHMDWFARQINTVTDVLRLMACMFGGDASLAAAGRLGPIKRWQRVQILTWMEGQKNIAEDMLRYAERWKRVGERLHPGDYAKRFPNTAQAFATICSGEPVERFNREVELLLLQADWANLVPLLALRPGELARRLDMLLCRGVDPQTLLQALDHKGGSISTAVLLQVMTHFEHRAVKPPSLSADTELPTAKPLRVFFPKGQVANVFARVNDRPALSVGVCERIVEWCEHALIARFAKLAPLGPCYLDPQLKTYLAPFAQRSASKALRTLARGSQFPLPFETTESSGHADHTLRFFVWWKNGRSRTDIDLSATLYDADYGFVDTLAYYRLKSYGAHHSGDIVDAPDGAAEFIDIGVQTMRDRGVRYVVMSISCYSGQPYIDLPECFAGWMAREAPNSGEVFEAKTVLDKIDITSDTVFCIPAIFDLVTQRVIWADIALNTAPQFVNNVANNLGGVSLMVRAMTQLKKTSLHRLFGLHIRARGERVQTASQAQTVFAVHEGITPFDAELIGAEYLV